MLSLRGIYEALHPESRSGVAGAVAQWSSATDNLSTASFAEATAAAGRDARTVRRDAERGEKIAPDVLACVAGTVLDRGSYLDQLKRLPEPAQRARVEEDTLAPSIG